MSYEPKTIAEINAYNQLFYERPQAVGIIMEHDQGQKKHPNEILVYAITGLQERVEAAWDGEGFGKPGYIDYDDFRADKERKVKKNFSNQEIAGALIRIGQRSILDNQGVSEQNTVLIDAISRVLRALEQDSKVRLQLNPVVVVGEEKIQRRRQPVRGLTYSR